MKKCKQCSNICQDEVKFCGNCGANEFVPLQPSRVTKSKGSKAGRKLLVLVGAIILLAVPIIILYSIANNPTKDLIECFEDADYSAAKEIYQEKIRGNTRREEKTYEEVREYVSMQEEQFENEELAYDVVIKRLRAVRNSGIVGNSVYEAIERVEGLHSARTYFEQAESAYEEKNYNIAIKYYSMASQYDFEHTDEAVEKLAIVSSLYRADVLGEAKKYIEQHSFQSARALLDNALSILTNDTELLLLKEECEIAGYDYTIQSMIGEADIFASHNDYIGALQCIDAYIESWPSETGLQQARESYLKQFESYVINKSMELAQNEDYVQAVSLAESGLKYFTSGQVTELLAVYKSHIPVLLGNMDLFVNNSEYSLKKDKYSKDNYSNEYLHSLSVGKGTIEYLVNFKYQTFSGTVGFPKGLDSTEWKQSATLIIYGDGQEIARFSQFSETSRPEIFSIDISSYEKISLKWISNGTTYTKNWGDFATIFDGVFTPVALELPTI